MKISPKRAISVLLLAQVGSLAACSGDSAEPGSSDPKEPDVRTTEQCGALACEEELLEIEFSYALHPGTYGIEIVRPEGTQNCVLEVEASMGGANSSSHDCEGGRFSAEASSTGIILRETPAEISVKIADLNLDCEVEGAFEPYYSGESKCGQECREAREVLDVLLFFTPDSCGGGEIAATAGAGGVGGLRD